METRQRISDRATRLFERDGFDNVTLAQVAEAADVSPKTVTNYFGAKEDLFFDAEPAILDALAETVRQRGPMTPTAALRPMIIDSPVLNVACPWTVVDDGIWAGMRVWSQCEDASATLRTRRAAILQSWLEPLAEAGGSAAWAGLMVGVLVLRHDLLRRGLLGGATPEEVERQVREVAGRALDAIERGF